jgi:para-nitrobenzyl esterase
VSESVEIRVPSGVVRGRREGRGAAFASIPYAAPPVGQRRFRPPEPVPPWTGVRDATTVGATSPQRDSSPRLSHLIPNVSKPGPDFLTLNIVTPDLSGALPVVVFIHGGSFVTGSNAVELYNGRSFARDGCVYVAINYRLGCEGFLVLDDSTSNRGLLDQIAALQWVKESIAQFGGDPHAVTVMGESAGAMSIGTLMTMPAARGLFSRAIMQSGAGANVQSMTSAHRVRERMAEILRVPATLSGFESVGLDAIIAAQERIAVEIARRSSTRPWQELARHLLPFEPVVDGVSLPESPQTAIDRGAASGVDVLIGYNAEEARLFFLDAPKRGPASALATIVLARRFGLSWRKYLSYRRALEGRDYDTLVAIVTDSYYRFPAESIAGSPGRRYMYNFDWRSPAENGELGAAHTTELPFVFDALESPDAAGILSGESPRELAQTMHRAWVDFIRSGNPGWGEYGPGKIVRTFGTDDETIANATARERRNR